MSNFHIDIRPSLAGIRQQAGEGDARAQAILGQALVSGEYYSESVEINIPEAIELFKRSAAQGDWNGQAELANRYWWGKDGIPRDTKKAFDLYMLSAKQGHSVASEMVGLAYHWGIGTQKDDKNAVYWLTKASKHGEKLAKYILGIKLLNGEGTEIDFYKAFKLMREAALRGDGNAIFELAKMYENGIGTPIDLRRAVEYYQSAAKNGNKNAVSKLNHILEMYDLDMDFPCINVKSFAKNPYRTLGCYSDASAKEIHANVAKIKAFQKVSKTFAFKIDELLSSFYQPVYNHSASALTDTPIAELYRQIQQLKSDLEKSENRMSIRAKLHKVTSEYEAHRKEEFSANRESQSIDTAVAELSQPKTRLLYALFWYAKLDDETFELLTNGDYIRAIDIQDKRESYSGYLNAAIINFSYGHFYEYVKYISKLIHTPDLFNELVTAICGRDYQISDKEISELLIDKLIDEIPSVNWKEAFWAKGSDQEEVEYVSTKLAQKAQNKALHLIKSNSEISHNDGLARYNGANKLKKKGIQVLQDIQYYVGRNVIYQHTSDKLADEILDCAFDFYKEWHSQLYDCTKLCYDLNLEANKLAVGTAMKEHVQSSLEEIKRRLDAMPPQEFFEASYRIQEQITFYAKRPQNIKEANRLIQMVAPLLSNLKELSNSHKSEYVDVSTDVVDCALSKAIAELNAGFAKIDSYGDDRSIETTINKQKDIEAQKRLLKDFWQLLLNLDLLDKETDYIEKRYKPNKATVKKNIDAARIDVSSMRPTISMLTEREVYDNCISIAAYQSYLTKFPKGKFMTEAKAKIAQLEKEDDEFWTSCKSSGRYSDYMLKYPQGRHIKELLDIERKAQQEKKAKEKAEDDSYWQACQKTEDFEAYILRYPAGSHAEEARTFIGKRSNSVKNKIFILNSLPLEERAKQKEKVAPWWLLLSTFLLGHIAGLYYWFADAIIFEYYAVSPFWGFVIFLISGIILCIAESYILSSIWSEYNKTIEEAENEIKKKIKSGIGSQQDLDRMRKDIIERSIKKSAVTREDFIWHSSRYCWGCGNPQISTPKPYRVERERTESWKEGAYRYTKTFRHNATINLCPDCYERLSKSKRTSSRNDDKRGLVSFMLNIIIAIGVCAYIIISEYGSSSIGELIFMAILSLVITFGLASSLGQIVIYPIASLIAMPFTEKSVDSSTKWSFDEIPEIRKFLNQNLPHTK